ncbi:MAG TPA: FhaA domain-containing protein, partial [Blastocatellia bacterium]|nr:FhaA domain-containing protein [Blastocatellia bacterium]
MADTGEAGLAKAERFLKRLFERMGAAVDRKLSTPGNTPFGPYQVTEIVSQLERSVEAALKPDKNGTLAVAPNSFALCLTYEDGANLDKRYVQALEQEMEASIFEFINNRRYLTMGQVRVVVSTDVLVKSTTIKASFEEGAKPRPPRIPGDSLARANTGTEPAGAVRLELQSSLGTTYTGMLIPGGAPVYLGRAAGSSIRIDE